MILYVRHGASKSKHRNKILNADKHSPASSARRDCVHEQVAKLDPVSRAAGMDCEYPLDKACHVHEKGDVL